MTTGPSGTRYRFAILCSTAKGQHEKVANPLAVGLWKTASKSQVQASVRGLGPPDGRAGVLRELALEKINDFSMLFRGNTAIDPNSSTPEANGEVGCVEDGNEDGEDQGAAYEQDDESHGRALETIESGGRVRPP